MPFNSEKAAMTDNAQRVLAAGILTNTCSESGTKIKLFSCLLPTLLASAPLHSSLLTLLLLLMSSDDVVAYLCWARDNEEDRWLADDIGIAIRTVALAAEGCKDPSAVATYEILGCHPDQLNGLIEARRRALLGNLYEAFWGVEARKNLSDLNSLPPKKTHESVPVAKKAAA